MRKHSNSKKWTVEVETWGAARARTVAKAVEREQVRRMLAWTRAEVRAEVRVQPWDLEMAQVRMQMQVVALMLLRAEERAQAKAAQVAEMVEKATKALERPRMRWLGRPRVRSKGPPRTSQASAWALELAEVHKAMRAWMQELGQAQLQAWMRVWALEAPALKHLIYPSSDLERDPWPSWNCRQDYWWLIQIITPLTRLPPELLRQILLIVIDNANGSPLVLMRVCKYWYNVVTGIWATLKLGKNVSEDANTRKLERNQWLLDVLVNTKIDHGPFTPSEGAYQAILAAMQATSRWRSLVVERFPAQADLSEHLVNRGLQQCSNLVMNRLRTFRIKCPCEMSPLLERLLRILGTSASRELTTVEIRSANVIAFLVPTYSSIFRSVTVLSLDTPGLSNPVDLLPHLHQLEALTASHLPLPVYHDDVNLPLVHTLLHLTLRSVSIQWMSGRTFHFLESCNLVFPLHAHVLHTFHTTLPNCKHLSFEGYPLDIVNGVSAHKLTRLSLKCSPSYKPRGNRQLALFSSQILQEGRLAPRILRISIEATNEAWTKALACMSNLEELVIGSAQPSSIGVKGLRSLVALPGTTATPGEWYAPACPSLKRLGLRYRRWLRPSEHFDLIPVLTSIIRSRQQSKCSLQSLRIYGDQMIPLELIDESQISLKAIECIASFSAIKEWN
jgi:hypothetical protein